MAKRKMRRDRRKYRVRPRNITRRRKENEMRDTEIMAILHDHPPEHNLKSLARQVFTERSLSGAHNGTEMC